MTRNFGIPQPPPEFPPVMIDMRLTRRDVLTFFAAVVAVLFVVAAGVVAIGMAMS